MKKNINDYKGTKTAIEVNSIEEFDRIKELLGHNQKGSNCFKERTNYISCFNDGYDNKEWWINKGFTLYKASDFLEEIPKFKEKKWLNVCIKQDKFIPEEDLHLYDESGLLIKKEEAMFKKNDYIVVLYNDNSLNSWTNQCFKQLEDLYYLKVVKNLNGNTDGWSVINFKNQSKWRYASSAEILEYERIGKPFDVTTLIKKEKSLVKQVQEGLKLKDRWVKCIKQCGWETINVGEYIQILENNSLVPYVEWKDNKEKYCIDLGRIDKAEFELMPEGFSPNEKEWIHNQYPLTPIESFQPSIYDLKDIHIPSITKKTKKLQTITIESTTDLNLNLTKIKSKQIQTIKI